MLDNCTTVMAADPSSRIIYKDVVVIGNGPSGISASLMLSGHVAYVSSRDHPDELLSARLRGAGAVGRPLARLPLDQLAAGLEGRTANPASLLLDALQRPFADTGMELAPLLHWRHQAGMEIDHVVLGKGPPGGSWHTMDPNVLTLSLGSWMGLPGLPFINTETTDSQRRASAGSVARYYQNYVHEMNLARFFQTGIEVVSVEPLNKHSNTQKTADTVCRKTKLEPKKTKECDIERRKCTLASAFNYIRARTKYFRQKSKESAGRSCKRPRDSVKFELSPDRKVRELIDRSVYACDDRNVYFRISHCDDKEEKKSRSYSFSCDSDTIGYPTIDKHNSLSNISDVCGEEMEIVCECDSISEAKWLIRVRDLATGELYAYSCNNLILANGSSDLPNRLELSPETYTFPWVLHDLRSLENHLDAFSEIDRPDPILVVGAGLSAADAIIATRFRSIPVLHVFRSRSAGLDKQLPENMYPEYHKVHQMMVDGGSTYPLYTALPEHTVTDISSDKTVTLTSSSGQQTRHKVSYVVVLIGARPNMHFLPAEWSLGINQTTAIDSKSNPIHINKFNHSVIGQEGLYAIGPVAGDNFVRFLPGGALAVVADIYRKKDM